MAEKYNLSSVGPTQSYLNSSRAPVKYVRSEADTLMFLIFSVLLAFAILSGNTMVIYGRFQALPKTPPTEQHLFNQSSMLRLPRGHRVLASLDSHLRSRNQQNWSSLLILYQLRHFQCIDHGFPPNGHQRGALLVCVETVLLPTTTIIFLHWNNRGGLDLSCIGRVTKSTAKFIQTSTLFCSHLLLCRFPSSAIDHQRNVCWDISHRSIAKSPHTWYHWACVQNNL